MFDSWGESSSTGRSVSPLPSSPVNGATGVRRAVGSREGGLDGRTQNSATMPTVTTSSGAVTPSVRRYDETRQPAVDGRGPLPCEHEKPGTWVRFDLIREYAARGYCCVHGFIPDEEEENWR